MAGATSFPEPPLDFSLTEEQTLLQRTVREFAENEVKPLARELDETGHFPRETFRKAAELGLTAVAMPETEGGRRFPDHVSVTPSSSKKFPACALPLARSSPCRIRCTAIQFIGFGTEEHAEETIPFALCARRKNRLLRAHRAASSNSNAAALATKAVRAGDRYILNGTKAWITNGGVADAAIVYTNTHPEKGEKGITALVVERGTPGWGVGKEEKKLGIHATACTELSFTDCEVPAANRIGNEGEGYKIALSTLDGGRIGIAAQATGIAQGALEQALAYAKQRQAFGHPIADFQAIQFMLADMATEIDAARLLVRKGRLEIGHRRPVYTMEASIAKLFASELATRATHKAMQIHVGYGYSAEYPIERMYRDARITEIYEGTSEIQRLVIAAWAAE